MQKRKNNIIAVITFTAALITSAMVGGRTQSAELDLLQDGMRNLWRTDNLEFTYASTIQSEGGIKSEKTIVWADQLTDRWVSENYITDEDGTWLYLKQLCDGRNIYNYVDWAGEWELQESQETDIPYFDRIFNLSYDSQNIQNLQFEQNGDEQVISYEFTQEYIDEQNQLRQKKIEEYYDNYQMMESSEEGANRVELAVDQYRQMKETDTAVSYYMDSAGVLQGLHYSSHLILPEVVYDENGQAVLGEMYESTYVIEIEISAYNQDGILNKIEQCRNEASYNQY